jgi:hypothetical protein
MMEATEKRESTLKGELVALKNSYGKDFHDHHALLTDLTFH